MDSIVILFYLVVLIGGPIIYYLLKGRKKQKQLQPRYDPSSYPIEDNTSADFPREVYTHKNQFYKKKAVKKENAAEIKQELENASGLKISDDDNRLYEYRILTPEDNFTLSTNPAVLSVYAVIVLDKDEDGYFDYWGHKGDGALTILMLLSGLQDQGWQDLIDDLPNWSQDQLELFLKVLTCFEGYYNEQGPEKDKWLRWVNLIPVVIMAIREKNGHGYVLVDDTIHFLRLCPNPALGAVLKVKEMLQEDPRNYKKELEEIETILNNLE